MENTTTYILVMSPVWYSEMASVTSRLSRENGKIKSGVFLTMSVRKAWENAVRGQEAAGLLVDTSYPDWKTGVEEFIAIAASQGALVVLKTIAPEIAVDIAKAIPENNKTFIFVASPLSLPHFYGKRVYFASTALVGDITYSSIAKKWQAERKLPHTVILENPTKSELKRIAELKKKAISLIGGVSVRERPFTDAQCLRDEDGEYFLARGEEVFVMESIENVDGEWYAIFIPLLNKTGYIKKEMYGIPTLQV